MRLKKKQLLFKRALETFIREGKERKIQTNLYTTIFICARARDIERIFA